MTAERFVMASERSWNAEHLGTLLLVQPEASGTRARRYAASVNGPPLLRVLAEEAQVAGDRWLYAKRWWQRDEKGVAAQLLHSDCPP
jgi:hypothetical protein